MIKRSRWIWVGLLYGILLSIYGFACAGFGHGTYLPLMMIGAPLSLIPFLGSFVAPILWSLVGWLLGAGYNRPARIVLILHEISLAMILLLGNPMEPGGEQWNYFKRYANFNPIELWGGLVLYGWGQLVAWRVITGEFAMQSSE